MSNVIMMTRKEIEDRVENLARKWLGVSREEAYKQLEQGKLTGTLAETVLLQYAWLLDS